ncbi:MAG: hypothetical protein GEV03_12330 [Streptosporangiales bacterium]|nr:hypothetical protein [Streptosporangiales bacterium]
MRLAEKWRQASQTIEHERDERTEQAVLRVLRDVLVVVLITLGAGVMMLAYWPMSDEARLLGLRLLPLVVLVVAAPVSVFSRHRHRSDSPEFRRARSLQFFLLFPVLWLAIVAVIYAIQRDLASALGLLVGGLVGGLVAAGISHWWAGRESTDRDS